LGCVGDDADTLEDIPHAVNLFFSTPFFLPSSPPRSQVSRRRADGVTRWLSSPPRRGVATLRQVGRGVG
jgi:hypothetical protein